MSICEALASIRSAMAQNRPYTWIYAAYYGLYVYSPVHKGSQAVLGQFWDDLGGWLAMSFDVII